MGLTVSNGYIVYTRGEQSSWYWKGVHNRAVADAGNISSPLTGDRATKLADAGARLVALGQKEMDKERRLIEAATGLVMSDETDIKTFIQNFNQVLMGKKQYEYALKRLKLALSKDNQGKKSRAPTIVSFFTSYLGTALNRNIDGFISKIDIEQRYDAWIANFDAIVNKSIDEAFKAMLTDKRGKENEMYGKKDEWREVYEASQQINGFNQYFRDMIRSKINFDALKTALTKEVMESQKGHKGIRTIIDSSKGLNLRNEKKSRSIGGSVNEFIQTLLYSIGSSLQGSVSSGGRVLTGEIAKTDTVTLFSYSQTINTSGMEQTLVDALNNDLTAAKTLQDTTQIMDNFYDQHLSKLDKSFIVYGSSKSYSMSDSFSGFGGGGQRSMEDIPAILAEAGVGGTGNLRSFLNAAYNTAEGAIFAGQRDDIIEDLKIGLMSAVAQLLFDDWGQIGEQTGGAQSIHVLQLEGIQLPLSALLIATGQAMIQASSNMESLVKISIKPMAETRYGDKPLTGFSKEEVLEKWEEEAARAKSESHFSMHFLRNFKSMITQWIQF